MGGHELSRSVLCCGRRIAGDDAASAVRRARPGPFRAAFQLTTSLLLAHGGGGVGILPQPLSRTNGRHTPYWGVAVFLAVAALFVTAAGAHEQRLVLFYAVAVFLAFLCGLASMGRFFWRERRWGLFAVSAAGSLAVLLTLAVNGQRGYPLASLAAASGHAGILSLLWVRAGRPTGVSEAEAAAEAPTYPQGRPAPRRNRDRPEPAPRAPNGKRELSCRI
jgi:hypothetical protein